MKVAPSTVWRALFVGGGLFYFVGAFHHPRGVTMAEMLVHPNWIPSHSAVFIGLVLMTIGLAFFRRSAPVSPRMNRWLLFTIILAVAETLEMGLHTIAYVDAQALPPGAVEAGLSTPVLTLHIWLATAVYTPFGVALIGIIWLGQRERSLGSPWIGWLGIVGAAAHGLVMWLAVVLGIEGSGILFPISALSVSLWFALAGLWPVRQAAASSSPDPGAAATAEAS